jgi:hypothetical protein
MAGEVVPLGVESNATSWAGSITGETYDARPPLGGVTSPEGEVRKIAYT